uniref:Uncharacterized protein n=1 Tax=Picea glauca TaxID=3330 RepID=A0A101M4B8_PICGL|nr:hypothetical protein ABT39_MTgene715 [Picea glauca]
MVFFLNCIYTYLPSIRRRRTHLLVCIGSLYDG